MRHISLRKDQSQAGNPGDFLQDFARDTVENRKLRAKAPFKQLFNIAV